MTTLDKCVSSTRRHAPGANWSGVDYPTSILPPFRPATQTYTVFNL